MSCTGWLHVLLSLKFITSFSWLFIHQWDCERGEITVLRLMCRASTRSWVCSQSLKHALFLFPFYSFKILFHSVWHRHIYSLLAGFSSLWRMFFCGYHISSNWHICIISQMSGFIFIFTTLTQQNFLGLSSERQNVCASSPHVSAIFWNIYSLFEFEIKFCPVSEPRSAAQHGFYMADTRVKGKGSKCTQD